MASIIMKKSKKLGFHQTLFTLRGAVSSEKKMSPSNTCPRIRTDVDDR